MPSPTQKMKLKYEMNLEIAIGNKTEIVCEMIVKNIKNKITSGILTS